MTIYNEGTLCISEENKDVLLNAMCNAQVISNINCVDITTSCGTTSIELTASTQCIGRMDYEFHQLCDLMKGIPFEISVEYFGDEEGMYIKEIDGELQILDAEEKAIHNAATDDLVEELKRRGYTVSVKTNQGLMPVEDYREITAIQHGFESYEDMRQKGYTIDR